MPMNSYMKVQGKVQGEIKGDCTQAGDKLDKIMLYATEHAVKLPIDAKGQPSGSRVHAPFYVTKAVDNSSPKLYKALCSSEECEVTIDFYRSNPVKAAIDKYFTVKMSNAKIVSMEQVTPNVKDPQFESYLDMEKVGFLYEKITWTYNDGNVEYCDEWKNA